MNEENLKTTLSRVADRAQQDPAALDRITTGRHRRDVRRRTLTATGAVATVAALAFAATQLLPRGAEDPGSFATDPPGPSGQPSVDPTDDPAFQYRVSLIGVPEGRRGVIYDAGGNEIKSNGFGHRTVIAVGLSADGRLSRMVGIDDAGSSRIYVDEIDPSCSDTPTDPCERLGDEPLIEGRIGAVDWSDPDAFAYLVSGDPTAASEQHVLYLDNGDGDPQRLWTFPEYLGRGVSSDDELYVEFSPDGSKVLVVNTFVDTAQERQDETMLVFDLDGNQVVPARNGTHARWSASGTIFYMPVDPIDDTWRELNVDTGEETEMPIALPQATNPALSPDGRSLAIENEGSNSITILDLEDGSTEIMPGAAPLWFDADTLLVTELEECEPDLCEVLPWSDTGRVIKMDVGEIVGEPFPISTTRGASALYGSVGEEPLELYPAGEQ